MKKNVILGGLLALSMFGLMGMGGNKEEAPKPVVGVFRPYRCMNSPSRPSSPRNVWKSFRTKPWPSWKPCRRSWEAAEEAKDDVKKQRLQVEMQQQLYTMQAALEAEQQKVVQTLQGVLQKVIGECRAERR